jgi:AhpD family alkylhydroperoxidase
MREFRRRIYPGPKALIADLRALLAHRQVLRAAMRGENLDRAFRERLMLVVTGVNECRYCSYVHAREALAAGVPSEQIEALAAGAFDGSPAHEAPALLYAQHWAEADGQPDREARQRVLQRYGDERLESIEAVLRLMRMANLLGNTVDYLLYRISSGRWGDPSPSNTSSGPSPQ